jgi:hypothetical protein
MRFFSACASILLNNKLFYRLAAAFLATLLLASCSSHPKGPPGKGILRDNDLVDLLVEMHYMENIFSVATDYYTYTPGKYDTLDYYQELFDKYGITRADFERTLEYYSFHPPRFEILYNRVVDELSRMLTETEMAQSEAIRALSETEAGRTDQLWGMDENWLFPGTDTNKMISFAIPVAGPGIYTFSADIRLDRNDYSVNPFVNIWFWYDDGTEEGYTDNFNPVSIRKDGVLRSISISKELNDPQVSFIRGRVLDMANHQDDGERSGEVRNIKLTRRGLSEPGAR